MFKCATGLFLISLCFVSSVVSQVDSFLYDFSQSTVEENGVTITGAGFGSIAEADYSFGAIPADNAFEGATDGYGLIIQADPGEGVMVFTPFLQIEKTALIRCSIRASASHVSAYLATIDQGQYTFVSTITPNNGEFFHGKYNRVADIFLPPSTGFQGLVQIINTSQTEPLTVYIDNLEVIPSGSNEISFAVSDIVGGSLLPAPTPTPLQPTNNESITVSLDLPSGAVPLEMVLIPAGTFMMGSPDDEVGRSDREGPQHQVTISQPFYMGKYEVTQAQWEAVMGYLYNPINWFGNNLPVMDVSWNDVQEFIGKLNQLGQGTYRLPTEAEWEYACRAGTTTRFYWGDDLDESKIDEYAWYIKNSYFRAREVGQKIPNSWGLYDMSGNVWEWCQDRSGEYNSMPQIDPIGPPTGYSSVLRGGGTWFYINDANGCRSACRANGGHDFRGYDSMGYRFFCWGFRLVKTYSTTDNQVQTPTPVFTIPTFTPTPTPEEPTNNESITVSLDLPSGAVPLEMVLIPAGTFMMGSPDSEEGRDSDEGPQHEVTISQPFYMGKYEVTQAQWLEMMWTNPSNWEGADLPVEQVSWNDVQEFIQKLNQLGQGSFRLPTEAEWEYACRAGMSTRYYWRDDLDLSQIGEYAWYGSNSANKTHEVGQKFPNAWGLYDMSGNVWEWCQDRYGSYGSASQTDPTGPSTGSDRVLRGGGWYGSAAHCRSANRGYVSHDCRDYYDGGYGFRLLRSYP